MQEIIDKAFDNALVQKIHSFAKDFPHRSFLIGGFVRDLFLYRSSKDIDIVVERDGIEFAKQLSTYLGASKVKIFKTYGTAHMVIGDAEIEIVNARKESYSRDSRKPSVMQGSLEDDQNRRDFTINALAISIDEEPKLIDPFNGLGHLDQQLIKTPTDPLITFDDDPLRMMRAIRFASQLGFKIDESTFKAIQDKSHRLKVVSQERITAEFNKIMLSPVPSMGFYLLDEAGLLEQFFPEFVALKGTETINGLSHKDNFHHTLEVLDNVALLSNDLWLRYSAVFHDIAKPLTKRFEPKVGFTFHGHEDRGSRMVKPIFRRLKLPLNDKMKKVQQLVLLHLRPIALTKNNVTDSAVRRLMSDAGEVLDDLFVLCQSDITSKNEKKKVKFLQNLELVKRKVADVRERDEIRMWQPVIGGNELMEWISFDHPRQIGTIKNAIKEAILDGELENSYDSCKAYALKMANSMGLQEKGGT